MILAHDMKMALLIRQGDSVRCAIGNLEPDQKAWGKLKHNAGTRLSGCTSGTLKLNPSEVHVANMHLISSNRVINISTHLGA